MPFYNAALDNCQWGRQYFDDRITNEDGQYFYVVTVPTAAYDMNGTSIRKDWMDALGLDTPTTIEELESLMAAMKSEYDLNNVLMVNNENYNTLFTDSLNFYPGLLRSGWQGHQRPDRRRVPGTDGKNEQMV